MTETFRSPEFREQMKPKEVSRVYITQAKPTRRLQRELTAYTEGQPLFLTQTLWAEKSSASDISAKQIQPVGGVLTPGETPLAGAMREAMEETHLRILGITPIGDITYTLKRPNKDAQQTKQHLFIGHALPLDVPYPINPEEDKFETFHELDIAQLSELYTEHRSTDSITLFGNLRLPTPDGQSSDPHVTLLEPEKNYDITIGMVAHIQEKEAVKRYLTVQYFFKLRKQHSDDERTLLHKLKSGDFFDRHNAFKEFLRIYITNDTSRQQFLTAFDMSNFEEEVQAINQFGTEQEKNKMKGTNSENVLRSILSFLFTHFENDTYLDIAEQNPQLREFIGCIRTFIRILFSKHDTPGSITNLDETFSETENELIEGAFIEAFGLPKEKIGHMLTNISEFITDLVKSAIIPNTDGTYHKITIDEYNDIRDADLATLIRIAFPGRKKEWKKSVPEPERQRMVFEARRKLALLYLLREPDQWYDTHIETRIPKIANFWSTTLPLSNRGNVSERIIYTDESKNTIDNIILFTEELDTTKPVVAQQTKLRRWSPKTLHPFLAEVTVRTKTRPSLYRKFITRGVDKRTTGDVYGRSISIIPDPEQKDSFTYSTTREKRILTVNNSTKEYEDFGPILDIIEQLHNAGFVITEYKPTPKDGEKIQSNGPGGGAPIRLAKFYIQTPDESQREEVQIFSPSTDGKSALYWKHIKEEDDKTYSIDRLIETNSLRSVTELLFPTPIYGEPLHTFADTARKKSKRART